MHVLVLHSSASTCPVSMQKGSVTSLLPPSALAGKRMLMHVSAMADRVASTTIQGCSPRCCGSAMSCGAVVRAGG